MITEDGNVVHALLKQHRSKRWRQQSGGDDDGGHQSRGDGDSFILMGGRR